MRPSVQRVIGFAALTSACATLATESQGDRDLPTSGAGPFRKLTPNEQREAPPFVLDDEKLRLRDPDALRASDDPRATEVILYATGAADDGADAVYRSRALDARTFYGTSAQPGARPRVVLRATKAWEGGGVRAPSAVRVPGGVWLYYEAAGGVGRARSADGLAFAAEDAPALPVAGARSPSVVGLSDGSFRMLYELGGRLWEAESEDGAAFAPRGVVLEPSPAPPPGSLEPGEKPPFDTLAVGDPCVSLRTTAAGRLQFRVLYTGTGADGRAIGFAARYGTEGPLARNRAPVFSTSAGDSSPALFEWTDGAQPQSLLSMLYDTEPTKQGYPAIAAALAPVGVTLQGPGDFPDAP